jgi:tol-pal system protein YbgF
MNRLFSSPRAAPVLLALLISLSSTSAHALFDDNEARKRIEQTNERLSKIEAQLDERVSSLEQQKNTQAVLALSTQIDALRNELAQLRGQIEVLVYEQSEAKKRQNDLYLDVSSRLERLESSKTSITPDDTANPSDPFGATADTGLTPGSNDASEQKAYDAAMEQFKRGDFANAAMAFTTFTTTWPQSPLTPSAQYWVGNAHFARAEYQAAIAAQTQLLQKYPDSQKAPDAMLNLASAQAEMGDRTTSRRTLRDLIVRYPNSDAAAKARQRLR